MEWPNLGVMFTNNEYRPCKIGKRKAIFHRWIEIDKVILQNKVILNKSRFDEFKILYENHNMIPPFTEAITTKAICGLVEFEDGTVDKVEPTHICFIDGKRLFDEYDWSERKEKEYA